MRSLFAVCLASTLAAVACGGGSPSMTAPSPVGGGTGSPGATGSATIAGSVTTSASAPRAAAVSGPMATTLVVQVVGTSLSVTVNADGSFTLTGVPSGDVRLRFTGSGTDATCTITGVQEQEQIQIKVTVTGSSAVIESQQRGNSDHSNAEVNGVVSEFKPPATAGGPFSFRIGSQLVNGDATTQFFGDGNKPDTVADLKDGVRVEVKGERQTDGSVKALRIHINDGTDDDDDEVEFEGKITAIGGTSPNLVLTLGSFSAGGFATVNTTSSTVVKRHGDTQSLSALQVGQRIEVDGTKDPGGASVTAKHISIEDDEVQGTFEMEGTLSGLKGTCPDLGFGVSGFSIYTSVATNFSGGQCSALRNGDKVSVKGTKQADGRVLASEVKKK